MAKKEQLGLVMSGGGTRGAYQMGVWKALREMELDSKLRVVTGASIGAINGALVAQQDWETALELWRQVQPHQVFNAISKEDDAFYTTLAREWWQHRGIRVDGLKELLRTHLDENKIRNSLIDFGLVVYNRSTRQGEELFPEDIPEGLLIEYIIASATFPIFLPHRIGEYEYIDGGIHSILPTKMAFDRQELDFVIAIDVAETSRFSPQQWQWHRRFAERMIYVRPSKMLPSPMNFSKDAFQRQLDLGYHDGLKKLEAITELAR